MVLGVASAVARASTTPTSARATTASRSTSSTATSRRPTSWSVATAWSGCSTSGVARPGSLAGDRLGHGQGVRAHGPEQCLGKRVDRRADVFSLGILLYEMSTLRRAFRAESDFETLNKIVKGEIAPPSSLAGDYRRRSRPHPARDVDRSR
ncbi:MAG: hypothetical protein HS111_01175 [Kofleriaceae bacterium]|nr:hypothetical protein [Kofleriaceae bacterium]